MGCSCCSVSIKGLSNTRQVFAYVIAITHLMKVDAALYVIAFNHDFISTCDLQGAKTA